MCAYIYVSMPILKKYLKIEGPKAYPGRGQNVWKSSKVE